MHADQCRSATYLFYESTVWIELLGQDVEVEAVGDGRGGGERAVEGALAVVDRI